MFALVITVLMSVTLTVLLSLKRERPAHKSGNAQHSHRADIVSSDDDSSIFHSEHLAQLDISPEGVITRANQAFLKMTGRSQESCMGMKLFELVTTAGKGVALSQCLSSGMSVTDFFGLLLCEDNASIPVIVNIPSRPTGKPVARVYITPDVSGGSDIDQSLLQFAHKIPAMLFRTDGEGRLTWASNRYLSFTGKDASEVAGLGWLSLIHPDDITRTIAYIKSEIAELREVIVCLRLRNHEGQYRHVQAYAAPLRSSQQKMSYIGIIFDVTQRVEAEAQMQSAVLLAQDAARAKSEFLATMSHELLTPMNSIISMTNLLLESPLQSEQREFAETVRSCSTALMDVIRDVLDFSRIESGTMKLDLTPFSPRVTVEECIEVFAETALTKHLDLVCTIEPDLVPMVVGDNSRIRQIVGNLVSNAIKFTESGIVQVHVTSLHRGGDLVDLVISVTDTGIGMSAATVENLFQYFTQADGSTTRRFGGIGLGLAMCHRLVNLMNGRISVSSQLGEGSKFDVILPLQRSEDQPSEIDSLFGSQVLLVGDKPVVLDAICKQLQFFGFMVHSCTASQAFQSWAMLGTSVQAVVLTQDGFDQLRLTPLWDALTSAAIPMVLLKRTRLSIASGSEVQMTLNYPVRSEKLREALRCLIAVRRRSVVSTSISSTTGTMSTSSDEEFQLRFNLPRLNLFEPMSMPVSPTPHSPVMQVALSNPPSPRFKSLVLVAEDFPPNQRVIQLLLAPLGYQCEFADNGAEAVVAVQRQDYVAVLMDCHMPVMDGYQATREIRALEQKTGKHVPIIAVTACVLPQERQRCMDAGMDEFLSKPVNREVLRETLARFTSSSFSELYRDCNSVSCSL